MLESVVISVFVSCMFPCSSILALWVCMIKFLVERITSLYQLRKTMPPRSLSHYVLVNNIFIKSLIPATALDCIACEVYPGAF
jgi:hypothetical protein